MRNLPNPFDKGASNNALVSWRVLSVQPFIQGGVQ